MQLLVKKKKKKRRNHSELNGRKTSRKKTVCLLNYRLAWYLQSIRAWLAVYMSSTEKKNLTMFMIQRRIFLVAKEVEEKKNKCLFGQFALYQVHQVHSFFFLLQTTVISYKSFRAPAYTTRTKLRYINTSLFLRLWELQFDIMPRQVFVLV